MNSVAITSEEEHSLSPGAALFVWTLVLFWVAAGLSALVMSVACFGKSTNTTDNLVGLLIAILLGPFYWIFYFGSKTYCK